MHSTSPIACGCFADEAAARHCCLGSAERYLAAAASADLAAYGEFANKQFKSRVLAEGISEAMNLSALFVVPSTLLYGASIVVYAIGSLMRPRAGSR